jgi:thioredoxin reductase
METDFEVIIVGGSYSGLSAGMALGRSMRTTLIIDGGRPCNIQTPHSHNFLTHDGSTPQDIAAVAKKQVEQYATIKFYNGIANSGSKNGSGFEISTSQGDVFKAKKLVFATGVKDIMPDIDGFAACWGISVLHCPYCHGFEVRNETTGIIANGAMAFEFAKMISNWTKDLTVFTNGTSEITDEQAVQLAKHNIKIVENYIAQLKHTNGYVEQLIFKDGTTRKLKALYAKPAFNQHCSIPEQLGCELTESGHIKVDSFMNTTVSGIYACGDNATFLRTLSNVVAMGTIAGTMTNRALVDDEF